MEAILRRGGGWAVGFLGRRRAKILERNQSDLAAMSALCRRRSYGVRGVDVGGRGGGGGETGGRGGEGKKSRPSGQSLALFVLEYDKVELNIQVETS